MPTALPPQATLSLGPPQGGCWDDQQFPGGASVSPGKRTRGRYVFILTVPGGNPPWGWGDLGLWDLGLGGLM